MAKPKPPPAAEDDGSSEIGTIYGDLITFMMCLFILLFVLVYNDKQDETFFTQMSVKFGAKDVEQEEVVTSEALFVSTVIGYIEQENLDELAQVLVDEHKIKIILDPPILFDSGKAKLKRKGRKVLRGFGEIIKDVTNPIIIEGHTDSVPIHNEEFDSNWDLSFYRSYSVVKYYINNLGFSPEQLSGLGYGEYRPRASNETREGRSMNRRIEINIIRIKAADGDVEEEGMDEEGVPGEGAPGEPASDEPVPG